MSYTGDRRGARARRRGSEASCEAAPAVDTTPSNESTATPKNTSPTSSPSSRFSLFTSTVFRHSSASHTTTPVSVPHDELMSLDVDAALYPSGDTSFSPAAYRNLQQNASGLLRRFQAAYQQNVVALHELKADRGAQADEREESETKMRHLKLQLEDMARKAAEREAAMRSLMDELAGEKRLRAQERRSRGSGAPSISAPSIFEDLGAEEDQMRRQWRRSIGGATARSDVGGDDTTDEEESVDEASVFSRSRSPTIATSITDASSAELPLPLPTIRTPVIVTPTRTTPTAQAPTAIDRQPQMNTFQKLFKGMGGESTPRQVVKSCQNCEGQAVSVAWDTVSLLKDENKGLKERVSDLEGAMEGALDVVNGVGL